MTTAQTTTPAYLFLDFDGVLHPWFHMDLRNKPYFEEAVRPWIQSGQLRIVFSTAWRYSHELEELKKYFSQDIQPHMVDVTPNLAIGNQPGGRQREVEEWLRMNGKQWAPWVALDDRLDLFDTGCKQLLWVDPEMAFTENHQKDLKKRFEAIFNQSQKK
jgi:HAD domain in Swiss Army Knife RNA repair proteins